MGAEPLDIAPAAAPWPRLPGARRWSAAVFARNEAASIGDCLRALARAGATEATVIVNGSTDGSVTVAADAMRQSGLPGRVYEIAFADKSNAINQYLHVLRPAAEMHVFTDAYAAVSPDSLRRLSARLADPQALAAAAVPDSGRSAAAIRQGMMASPGLHGSLFALRGDFVERLAASGLRLPLGLYRGDGLLGSFVMHDLDALGNPWGPPRIAVEPEARWKTRPLRPWRPADLRRHWHRLLQQGRGRLESAAIRHAIYAGGFGALPATTERLVLDWLDARPDAAPDARRDPLAAIALRRIRRAGPAPGEDALRPRLVAAVGR
ncbi:MAG TPA: glycosyltransferase [Roseomonas sp.]|jgi:glycosyltransferase involved in cell wall biosynthesis